MFSYEERLKAVELYLKYESWVAFIRELGYPNKSTLRNWVKEYQENNALHQIQTRRETIDGETVEFDKQEFLREQYKEYVSKLEF